MNSFPAKAQAILIFTFIGSLFYSCMDLVQNVKAYENRS